MYARWKLRGALLMILAAVALHAAAAVCVTSAEEAGGFNVNIDGYGSEDCWYGDSTLLDTMRSGDLFASVRIALDGDRLYGLVQVTGTDRTVCVDGLCDCVLPTLVCDGCEYALPVGGEEDGDGKAAVYVLSDGVSFSVEFETYIGDVADFDSGFTVRVEVKDIPRASKGQVYHDDIGAAEFVFASGDGNGVVGVFAAAAAPEEEKAEPRVTDAPKAKEDKGSASSSVGRGSGTASYRSVGGYVSDESEASPENRSGADVQQYVREAHAPDTVTGQTQDDRTLKYALLAIGAALVVLAAVILLRTSDERRRGERASGAEATKDGDAEWARRMAELDDLDKWDDM